MRVDEANSLTPAKPEQSPSSQWTKRSMLQGEEPGGKCLVAFGEVIAIRCGYKRFDRRTAAFDVRQLIVEVFRSSAEISAKADEENFQRGIHDQIMIELNAK